MSGIREKTTTILHFIKKKNSKNILKKSKIEQIKLYYRIVSL